MKGFKLLAILSLIVGNDCNAYVWEECNKDVYQPIRKKFLNSSGAQAGLLTVTSGAPTSTSQFASSTGGCSANLKRENEVKEFVYQNFDQLMFNSSKGGGEYLNAYGGLMDCEGKAQDRLSSLFQNNFINIYGKDIDKTPEEVYESLREIMKTDPIVLKGCKLDIFTYGKKWKTQNIF